MLIAFAFFCYILRGALSDIITTNWQTYITIISNSVTLFTFMYFLLLISDSILGLWNLIEENNRDE